MILGIQDLVKVKISRTLSPPPQKKYLSVMISYRLSSLLSHKFGVFATCFGYQNVSLDSQFVGISNPWGLLESSRFQTNHTLPKTSSSPLKIYHPKRKLDSQPSIFRGELLVSWRVIQVVVSNLFYFQPYLGK